MLPRDGSELPRWRRHVMVVVMALVRLAVGWLLVEGPITVLVLRPGFISAAIGAGPRLGVAALLGAGLAAFAWPRSCLYGFALLSPDCSDSRPSGIASDCRLVPTRFGRR